MNRKVVNIQLPPTGQDSAAVDTRLRGTTVDQIAERAGVSKPTVFASAGSKRSLLKDLYDLAVAGDDQPVPVAERLRSEEALHDPTRGGH